MSARSCGCTTATCGCCEGTKRWTPAASANRPGLDALRYRVGTHGQFLESMKARLGTMTVEAPGADQQTIETFRPLTALTTRDPSDPSIALLDGWAIVGDVLTFYQERIANEGFLRTATERRSILELARLTGYALRPGVASTAYLAYALDDKQVDPVEIPAGARSQTIPGPGELPQSFETAEPIVARNTWNNLQVRLRQAQDITLANILSLTQLYVGGTATNLKPGDKLLFRFDSGTKSTYAMRAVAAIEADFTEARTRVEFQSVPSGTPESASLLVKFLDAVESLGIARGVGPDGSSYATAIKILDNTRLGIYTPPGKWVARIQLPADGGTSLAMTKLEEDLQAEIEKLLATANAPKPITVTDPSKFVTSLLMPAVQQARSSAHLARNLGSQFVRGSDAGPQLLVNFERKLADTYYVAWSNATASAPTSALSAVYALRVTASLFGALVPKIPKREGNVFLPQNQWDDWSRDESEFPDQLYLDQLYDIIAPDSLVVIQTSDNSGLAREVFGVTGVEGGPHTAYGLSGKSTHITLEDRWWPQDSEISMPAIRSTLVYAQSETLTLVDGPIIDDVSGQELVLDALYSELKSGRWVIVSGERTDIAGVTGVRASELMMISGLRHDDASGTAGGKSLTTLRLATRLAYSYKRSSVVVFGNVVKATHGETRQEPLGSGDAAQALQTFVLKQPPVTFVSAPNASGVESTLHVYVNEVEWKERTTLTTASPGDRIFVTKTDDDAKVAVIFGNGRAGARLPTGLANVRAQYRNGIGKPGNVKAEQISQLQTRPLGVKSVINPLRSSGGADRENLDQARGNAPLAVLALDRLVSLQDYQDFARTFAGVGKALVKRLTDGGREFVHLTIAGADDIPIDTSSDLYLNLLDAIRKLGDPDLPVQVDARERVALVLSANVKLAESYQWDDVAGRIRTTLLDRFGFSKRALAQPALLCEVIGALQGVRGVAYVDVDTFGGIPEKDPQTRILITPDAMSAMVQALLQRSSGERTAPWPAGESVPAATADATGDRVTPAQIAVFVPEVLDTLILNVIV